MAAILGSFGGSLEHWSRPHLTPSTIARYVPGNVWQPLASPCCVRRNQARSCAREPLPFHVIHLMAISAITVCYLAIWETRRNVCELLSDWRAAPGRLPRVEPRGPRVLTIIKPAREGRTRASACRLSAALVNSVDLVAAWLCLSTYFVVLPARDSVVRPSIAIPHLAGAYVIVTPSAFSLLTPAACRAGRRSTLLAPIVGRAHRNFDARGGRSRSS